MKAKKLSAPPPPKPRHPTMKLTPTLTAMKVGGYEFFEGGKPNSIAVRCHQIAAEKGWTFQTRKAKAGVEVWRTA